jgi:acetyl-CoA acetyltransferase
LIKTAIAGVGYTEFTRKSGRSVLSQAREACLNAIEDAGLKPEDIDGINSFSVSNDSVPCQAVATVLGIPQLRYSNDLMMGGQAACNLVLQASNAVACGQAKNVLVFRAMNGKSGNAVGTMQFHGMGGQYRYPLGYDAYMMYVGMWGRRFLYETGQNEADLAAVAIAQRNYAQRNPRALLRNKPLDADIYASQNYVVDPYRMSDCTVEVDGACAVLVTSLEHARDLRHKPAVIAAGAYRAGVRSGLDIGDHLSWDDYTRNYTSWLRDELYGAAGVTPKDVTFAEIYDCFTTTVLMSMEGMGLCERGEAGALHRSGGTALTGRLPTNTHGGLLSEGYLHGMNTVCEAVMQMQGRGGELQVPNNRVCAVTSGALMDGSAMILTQDQ